MSHGENALLAKLKHSLAEKQHNQRFTEMLHTNIRLNRDQRATQIEVLPNGLLPTISQTRASLTKRVKSHSSKRLGTNPAQEKLLHQRSTRRLSKEGKEEESGSKKMDLLEGLLVKKQSVIENSGGKQSAIRSKLFSLKTPSRGQPRAFETTGTKDASNAKLELLKSAEKQTMKELTAKMQKLNKQLLLSVRMGRIDSEVGDNKKIFANLMGLKNSNEQEYTKYNRIITNISKFIAKFKIESSNIEFRNIMQLSNKKVLSNHQMLNLFPNRIEIASKVHIPGLQYYTVPELKGRQLAAQRITSFFKMLFSKRFYGKFKSLIGKVLLIQRYWRASLMTRRTRRQVLQAINAKIQRHSILQRQLAKNWPIMKTSTRIQVHICSYSLEEFKRLTLKSLSQRQNNQITRIFRAMETDVSVIYVSPFQLPEEIMKYYASIFQFSPSRLQEKIFFISPENRDRFEGKNLTTTALLLYSPKALKRLKQLIGKQYAYIVPSFPSVQYANLSAQLDIPVLSSNQNLSKLYSTKSGCMRIFKSVANKQKPPFYVAKSVQSIFSQKELINSLAVLIHKNKHIKSWYFKIEDEIQSRGLAYLNINKIAFLRELCNGEGEFEGVADNEMIRLIADELTQKLKHRLKIVNKDVYADYDQFISHFLTRGGVVQAGIQGEKLTQFSISFFVDPCGEFNIIGTYNKLQLNGKSITQAVSFPSSLSLDYELITRNLYKQLWQKHRLFGFFTADFVTSEMFILPYAIGLDCFLNQKTSSLFMVSFCSEARYDKDSNRLTSKLHQDLRYIYCPTLSLLRLPVTNTFFKSCKYENISYDLEKKLGTIFVLLDRLENEQISFFCLQDGLVPLLREVKRTVEYFSKHYRESKSTHDDIGLLKGAVTTWLKRYDKSSPLPKDFPI